ncbi:TipAS antibiotic-recognition domain-containing protein [Guptibacillus algicola]|uniref:TipAS antibiotic-recognition domain-containing protein n=1 Tax=Guptibacillus algicola TaxID=225844 RepID=UPI001CD7958A|nr:TipAS antibiotic-recognition domain-containing protein [Alkalihalobacillus algicola]MCA0987566.1 TipAS antibiotic-recognition domain-containing protein [Alkalihalobacillus algicola]
MPKKGKFEAIAFFLHHYEERNQKMRKQRLNHLSKTEKRELTTSLEMIYKKLVHLSDLPPESIETQSIIDEWYHILSDNFNGMYSLEEFQKLGDLYVKNDRFKRNIDKYGAGLATYMREAIACYIGIERNKTTG